MEMKHGPSEMNDEETDDNEYQSSLTSVHTHSSVAATFLFRRVQSYIPLL